MCVCIGEGRALGRCGRTSLASKWVATPRAAAHHRQGCCTHLLSRHVLGLRRWLPFFFFLSYEQTTEAVYIS